MRSALFTRMLSRDIQALGLGRTEPHGGKCGFDDIGGAQMKPVLRRKVTAGQQFFPVLFQAVGRLRVLGPVHFQEVIKCLLSLRPGGRHPDFVQRRFGLRLLRSWPAYSGCWPSCAPNSAGSASCRTPAVRLSKRPAHHSTPMYSPGCKRRARVIKPAYSVNLCKDETRKVDFRFFQTHYVHAMYMYITGARKWLPQRNVSWCK